MKKLSFCTLLHVLIMLLLLSLVACQPTENPSDVVLPDDGGPTDPDTPEVPGQPTDTEVPEYYFARGQSKEFVPTAHYPEDDLIICSKNILNFNVKTDGSKDASDAFQKALNAVAASGGGTLYVPAGTYYLTKAIQIPDTVVLCGDWVSPEQEPAGTRGTVLILDFKSRTQQPQYGYIKLGSSSGLRNVTIYHKHHSFEMPQKVAPTVWSMTQSQPTVENVTILNAYTGVSFGEGKDTSCSLSSLTNVYISALSRGVVIGNSYDTARLEGVHVSPEYLANNVIEPLSDDKKNALRDYTFANCVGITLYRGDATGLYDTYLEQCNTGILLTEDPEGNGVTSGTIVRTQVKDCDIGIMVDAAHGIGTAIVGFEASAQRVCTSAIETGERYTYHTKVEDGSITGTFLNAGVVGGQAALSFTDVTFDLNSTDYVLLALKGAISCAMCHFEDEAVASDGGGRAAIYLLDCTFAKEPLVDLGASSTFTRRDSATVYTPIKEYHVYRDTMPGPARREIVSITEYGAKGDGRTDSTQAIQDALNAMAAKGGGIVLVPAGKFVVKGHLTVPSGVELAGMLGTWCYSSDAVRGSCLLLYAGAGSPSGQAAISLEESAGMRGILAWYPEQDIDDITEYSYAIRSLGKNTYVINVNVANAYQYMDFGTHPSEGHYIRNCAGMAILRGLYIGNNSGEGWVENVHLNQHQMYGLSVAGVSGGYQPSEFDHAVYDILIHESEGFVFGYNQNEHVLGTFCLGAYAVYRFEEQGGKVTSGTFVQIGADGCRDAIAVYAAGELNMIAPGNVSLGQDRSRSYVRTLDTFDGTFNIWGSAGYGGPTHCFVIGGGTINISTFTFASFQNSPPLLLKGGDEINMVNCVIPFTGSSANSVVEDSFDGLCCETGTLTMTGIYGYSLSQTLND